MVALLVIITILLFLLVWGFVGLFGFLLYAKALDYDEVDSWVMEECWCMIILGPIGLLIGIMQFISKSEIPVLIAKCVQKLLDIMNHKFDKNKEK